MKALKYIVIMLLITTLYSCKRVFKSDTTEVYGKITDIETKEPISNEKIVLYEGMSANLFSGSSYIIKDTFFTDENGEYRIEFKQDNKYNYSIEPIVPYYVYYEEVNGRIIGSNESLWEGRLQKKNFKLTRYGNSVIKGYVTEENTGNILEGVSIIIVIHNNETDTLAETVTDAQGFYEMSFLQKYYIYGHNDYVMLLTLNSHTYRFGPYLVPDKTIEQDIIFKRYK